MNTAPSHHLRVLLVATGVAALAGTARPQNPVIEPVTAFEAALDQAEQRRLPLLIRLPNAPVTGSSRRATVLADREEPQSRGEEIDDAVVFDAGATLREVRRELALNPEDPQPRYALLMPNGAVFEFGFGERADREVRDQVARAHRLAQHSQARQDRELVQRFRARARKIQSDSAHRALARASLGRARPELFVRLLAKVGRTETTTGLLEELAVRRPDRTRQQLEAAREDLRHGSLRRIVEDVLARLPELVTAAGPALPTAQPVPGVCFCDRVDRPVIGQAGQVTVLLFFVHHDRVIDDHVRRWNRLREKHASESVRFVALGATLSPEAELPATRELGFGFPAGNYQFDRKAAAYGVTMFPHAVVLDGVDVAYSGNAYGGVEREVARILAERESAHEKR